MSRKHRRNGTAGEQGRARARNKEVMELKEKIREQEQETNRELNCRKTGQNMRRKQETNGTAVEQVRT